MQTGFWIFKKKIFYSADGKSQKRPKYFKFIFYNSTPPLTTGIKGILNDPSVQYTGKWWIGKSRGYGIKGHRKVCGSLWLLTVLPVYEIVYALFARSAHALTTTRTRPLSQRKVCLLHTQSWRERCSLEDHTSLKSFTANTAHSCIWSALH